MAQNSRLTTLWDVNVFSVSNKYFPTFNRDNVELVTDAIQELTADSIITKDGKMRKIDCLIYGTGFITDPRIYLQPFSCIGEHGVELKQAWKDGAESYYGISHKGFPTCFSCLGQDTVLAHNSVIFMIESQVDYILQMMDLGGTITEQCNCSERSSTRSI